MDNRFVKDNSVINYNIIGNLIKNKFFLQVIIRNVICNTQYVNKLFAIVSKCLLQYFSNLIMKQCTTINGKSPLQKSCETPTKGYEDLVEKCCSTPCRCRSIITDL